MTTHHTGETHGTHEHPHGPDCGHDAVAHDGHVDYLHGGHLHHPHDDHTDEHVIESSTTNPAACTPAHECGAHAPTHRHGEACDHEPVPHAGHFDYLVSGHLHHPHGDHCDDHGQLAAA